MTKRATVPDASAVIDAARHMSTATLHEAGGRIGALPASIQALDPDRILCGRAFPVLSPPGDNLFLHHAIYGARPGDVLVVDTSGEPDFGYWGEIMAAAAQARKLAGLVIAGCVRDSRRMVEMGFPVFCTGSCIRGTGKNPAGGGRLGEPVRLGGVSVALGDVVLGDADGVVVLPVDRAADIIAEGARRDAAEIGYLERIGAGETTLSIYGLPDPVPDAPAYPGQRRSVEVEGLSHGHLPIPAASRKGRMIATGGVRGVDPRTGAMPEDVDGQARLMFENLRSVIEAAGAECRDIYKVTIWGRGPEARAAVNEPWRQLFPDPASRPARHFLVQDLPGGMLVQCEALAVAE